ncbi:MAG: TIR domain-containing protein [Methylocystis sp.]
MTERDYVPNEGPPPTDAGALNVFISYSRDDLGFADQLVAALESCGFNPTIDRQAITGGEEWKKRLGNLIHDSDTVVFVLSPSSAKANMCAWEVEEAARFSKRILPVICRPIDGVAVPPRLQDLNYIFFYEEPKSPGSGFGAGLAALATALKTDIEWIREHTRVLARATEWNTGGRTENRLLSGADILAAKQWASRRPRNAPELTALQLDFIKASEVAEEARQDAARKQIEERERLLREAEAAQKAQAEALAQAQVEQKAKAEALGKVAAEQKQKERAQRRAKWLVGTVAVLAIGFFGAAIWQSRETEGREAAVMTSLADKAIHEQFSDRALRIALQASPKPGSAPWSLGWGATPMRLLEATLAGAAMTSRHLAVLRGHEDRVSSAAFSPDGARIATASYDNTARLWDAASGKQLAVLLGHEDHVFSAVFSPDGGRIATASKDKTARLWDAASRKELAVLRGHERPVYSAVFSPDGGRIATASLDNTARLWDAATGKQLAVLLGHEDHVFSAVFSPNGGRIATASLDNTARLWDAASGKQLAVLRGHEDSVWSAVFSPDGGRIATASGDKTARLWDAASGKQLAVLRGHEGPVHSAVFSPDGERIATASDDKTARLWDAASGKQLAVLRGHESEVRSAVFSPDGKRIATASEDKTARLWDATSAVLRGHEYLVHSAVFSPDGGRIATASADKTARLWDAASGKQFAVLRGHEATVFRAAFSPDGKRIATASEDNTARLWDAASGKEIAALRGHEGPVESVVFSPDGTRIVTASSDNTARLWDAASGREIAVLRGHEGEVYSATFSPDGSRIATASEDGTARLWGVHWAMQYRGDKLREAVCKEKLRGVEAFTPQDASDPILYGLENTPPCDRVGPLSAKYWRDLAASIFH